MSLERGDPAEQELRRLATLPIGPQIENYELSSDPNRLFNLVNYAEAIPLPEHVPSYADLRKGTYPVFEKFLEGLRERLRGVRENGKKVLIVLGTGGTFQSAETDHGLAPLGSLRESFNALGLPEDPSVYVELCDLMNLDSSQMNVDHWRFLAEAIIAIESKASDIYDAIIVTHGTDTMAKGAAYLAFMLQGFPKSIIFTGSQEPARKRGSDAKDQMERAITTAKIASRTERLIAEVMIACGLRVTRAVWGAKLGDKTINVFGPWNQPQGGFDASDWDIAAQTGTLHKLAPALLDYGTGKSYGSLKFARHAIDHEHKGPFQPFTDITNPADIIPATLTDKSPIAFAGHLIRQRINILTQLGSATADDRLVAIALEAARRGKIVLFQAPFADSKVQAGTYAAGAAVRTHLDVIQRKLPILNTSPAALDAKTNFALSRLGIKQVGNSPGLGVFYSSEDLRMFYDLMEQNLVGELV